MLTPKATCATLGGFNPIPQLLCILPSAEKRPLYDYLKPSEVFRCPADKGQAKTPCPLTGGRHIPLHNFKPTKWEAAGCSYDYNAEPLMVLEGGGLKEANFKYMYTIASRSESAIPEPSRFILMHEPPARIYGCPTHGPEWYQWHFSRIPSDISDPVYARQQFISPVLFADGHAAVHNFSKSLSTDPFFPYEPTKDWIWYIPHRTNAASAILSSPAP